MGYGVTPGNGPTGLPGLYGMIFCMIGLALVMIVIYFESNERSKHDWYEHQFVHTNDSWKWFTAIFLLTLFAGILMALTLHYYSS